MESRELLYPRIHRLPAQLANQIAAGEVVDRPSSVAKELIENSLDAGATRIDISVDQGGRSLIRVTDNGCGIQKEDLMLALERHATSKLFTLDDLTRIVSLGFRGEALPSIASVSRFRIKTRHSLSDHGWAYRHGKEKLLAVPAPVAHPVGTTVEVRDLFYNTPARRKFLRTDKTEFTHIHNIVARLALSRFDVGFSLAHNSHTFFNFKPESNSHDRERRIAIVFGKAFVEQALSLEFEATGLRLSGWIARPGYMRWRSDQQYFYINGRNVRDKLMNHAIRQAYQDNLDQGHPAYALYLELDPGLVDVNVHPAKHDVRFRESRLIHDFIYSSVNDALKHQSTMPLDSQNKNIAHYPKQPPASSFVGEQIKTYGNLHSSVSQSKTNTLPLGEAITQLHSRYLLASNSKGFVMVDIKSARQHIAVAKLQTTIKSKRTESMPLLMPLRVSVTQTQAGIVEKQSASLSRLGFDLGLSGPTDVLVRSIPSVLRHADIEFLVRDVLNSLLKREPVTLTDEDVTDMIAIIAPHAGIKDEQLTTEGMNILLRDLESIKDTTHDMIERSAWKQVSLDQIDRMFMHKANA